MNESEAIWLKSVLHNPSYRYDSKKEEDSDREIRRMLWDILDKKGIRSLQKEETNDKEKS